MGTRGRDEGLRGECNRFLLQGRHQRKSAIAVARCSVGKSTPPLAVASRRNHDSSSRLLGSGSNTETSASAIAGFVGTGVVGVPSSSSPQPKVLVSNTSSQLNVREMSQVGLGGFMADMPSRKRASAFDMPMLVKLSYYSKSRLVYTYMGNTPASTRSPRLPAPRFTTR